jgi:hypothetical protein
MKMLFTLISYIFLIENFFLEVQKSWHKDWKYYFPSWGLYYKTFYGCNLQIFVMS